MTISVLIKLTWMVPRSQPCNKFFAFDTEFNSGKMNVSFNGQDGHDCYDKFFPSE